MPALCLISLNKDQNLDGFFTISDVTSLLKEIFFIPGKLWIELFGNTDLAVFFELSPFSCTSMLTAAFSFFAWWIFLAGCGWSLRA